MSKPENLKGDLYILAGAVLWAFFPIITILSFANLVPAASLAFSTMFACAFFAIVMAVRGKFRELFYPGIWKYSFLSAFFIGWLFYGLYFTGLKYTTAGNSGIIALMELFFSYLLFNVWKKEDFAYSHRVGAALMLLGALVILFPKQGLVLHGGDFLILLATMCAPWGNYYQQKLMQKISSETLMFIRSALSFPVFFLLAFFQTGSFGWLDARQVIWFLLINGAVVLGLSKIFWLEGIHRISVTRANALSSITPFFTLLLSYAVLKEQPQIWQWMAFVPIFFGTWLLTAERFKA